MSFVEERIEQRLEQRLAPEPSDLIQSGVRVTSSANLFADDDGNKRVNQYVFIKNVGRGSYGKAIKVCNKDVLSRRRNMGSRSALEDVALEVEILKRVRHPNVIRLHEVIDDPTVNKLYMVEEYAKGGPLVGMDSDGIALPMDQIRKHFREIVAGLSYLHSVGVVHGDLKPDNLLVGLDGTVKITDFGVSVSFAGEEDAITHGLGSPAFTSPELCQVVVPEDKLSGRKCDIWALGVTLFMLVFGRLPFVPDNDHILSVYHKILKEKLEFPWEIPAQLENLLESLLDKDPVKRISLPEIKTHAWVTRNGAQPMPPDIPPSARDELFELLSQRQNSARVGSAVATGSFGLVAPFSQDVVETVTTSEVVGNALQHL